MVRESNISVRLVDLTRKAPRLVSSGEILGERVQLSGLVIIHPLGLLLRRLWSVSLVNLRLFMVNNYEQARVLRVPWVESDTRSEAAPSHNSAPCSYQRLPGSSCTP